MNKIKEKATKLGIDPDRIPFSLRLPNDELRYRIAQRENKTRPITDMPAVIETKFLKLVKNEYPATRIFSKTGGHYMIIPKNPKGEINKTVLRALLKKVPPFDLRFRNPKHRKSVKDIDHIHCIYFENDPLQT